MDLSSIQHNGTTEITIYDPWGDPTDIVVELYGRDTKEYRKAVMEIARDQDSKSQQSDEEADRRGAQVLLAAVKSWTNVSYQGEEVTPQSKEAVELLARTDMDWFASQIHKAINNRALFFSKRENG
jgi:Lon protease-like protein